MGLITLHNQLIKQKIQEFHQYQHTGPQQQPEESTGLSYKEYL